MEKWSWTICLHIVLGRNNPSFPFSLLRIKVYSQRFCIDYFPFFYSTNWKSSSSIFNAGRASIKRQYLSWLANNETISNSRSKCKRSGGSDKIWLRYFPWIIYENYSGITQNINTCAISAKPLLSRLSLTPAKLKSLSIGLKQIADSSLQVWARFWYCFSVYKLC